MPLEIKNPNYLYDLTDYFVLSTARFGMDATGSVTIYKLTLQTVAHRFVSP